jgi:MSHA biogenesis protein MshI
VKVLRLGGQKNDALCCVTFTAEGVSVAVRSQTKQGLTRCAFLPASTDKDAQKVLAEFVQRYRLKGAQCHYVLQPNQYRLFYLDAPLVLEEELPKAARWMVKDLLQYPVEQSVVDVMQVPVRSGQPNKVYVVAAHLETLQARVQFLKHVGLSVVNISITEVALSALLKLKPESEQGVGLLYRDANNVHLVIAKLGLLRMVRDIASLASLNGPKGEERLYLEIQRSLDFYQSYLADSRPIKLFITPDLLGAPLVLSQVQKNVGLPVEKLELTHELFLGVPASLQEVAQCFIVLGQALQSGALHS